MKDGKVDAMVDDMDERVTAPRKRTKRETDEDEVVATFELHSTALERMIKRMVVKLGAVLGIPFLAIAGGAFYKSWTVEDTAVEAKALGETGAQRADQSAKLASTAKSEASAAYEATKQKLEPTGIDVAKLRRDVNALIRSQDALRRRLDRVTGLPSSSGTGPRPSSVAPEVVKPLPPTPAAAASAPTGGRP